MQVLDLPQAATAEQQVNDQQQHDHGFSIGGRRTARRQGRTELFLEPQPLKQGLNDQQPAVGRLLLVFETNG